MLMRSPVEAAVRILQSVLCEQCGKVLVRRRDLERHIKSRHSPPPGLSDPNLSSSSATQTSGLYSTLTHR
uniref:C2H2-type domain-containing protein n=1 Tax=Timema poppense TaxID=170557 RepID=A0A7R9CNT2_TIMPO|nr:unnamed protein product [Timema poppensis]